MTDIELMKLAAEQMLSCSTHPRVGAVVAKDGAVLATGFRGEQHGKHAERVALEKLPAQQREGATLYTTLEPCVEMEVNQQTPSCCQFIVDSKIESVCIGVLDPNGKIYANGMHFLRAHGLAISSFLPELRDQIEQSTFKYDDFSMAVGSNSRRVRSVRNGKRFTVQFAENDDRKVQFSLSPLSMPKDKIELVAANDSVRHADNVSRFDDIVDPMLYQDASHYARLAVGEIAIVSEPRSSMVLLVQIEDIKPTDIFIKWRVMNKNRR